MCGWLHLGFFFIFKSGGGGVRANEDATDGETVFLCPPPPFPKNRTTTEVTAVWSTSGAPSWRPGSSALCPGPTAWRHTSTSSVSTKDCKPASCCVSFHCFLLMWKWVGYMVGVGWCFIDFLVNQMCCKLRNAFSVGGGAHCLFFSLHPTHLGLLTHSYFLLAISLQISISISSVAVWIRKTHLKKLQKNIFVSPS